MHHKSRNGPNLWECRSEDHDAALMMQFDKETNRADYGSEPFSCLIVLLPSLFILIDGDRHDPRCI